MKSPKLRFKSFTDEFSIKKIRDIAEIKTGNKDTQNKISDGRYPFFVRSNTVERINSYSFDGEAILTSGDGVGVGKNFHYINGKFDFHQRVYSIRNFESEYDGKFIYFIFREKFYDRVKRLSAKNSVDSIRMDMIADMKLGFPNYDEQKQIASFIQTVENRLTNLKEKRELLEKFKKGLMTKVFSQQLRFKDNKGNNYPDWIEDKISKFVKIYDGTHQTPTYVLEGIPFYSVEHVTANNFSKSKFITKEIFEKENLRVKLEKGDVLMTRIGDIGTSKLIDWDVKASFYVSLALLKCSEDIDSAYLNQFIKSPYFQKELWERTIHVAFPKKINLGEIGECKIKLPHLQEQKKIASLLSKLDVKIALVQQEIMDTELWKKGLLQKMFV